MTACGGNLRQIGGFHSLYADEYSGYLPRGGLNLNSSNTYLAGGQISASSEQGALARSGYLSIYDLVWCPSRVSYQRFDSYEYNRNRFNVFCTSGAGGALSSYIARYHVDSATYALNMVKDARVAKLPVMWDFIGYAGYLLPDGSRPLTYSHPNGYMTLYGGGHVRWLMDMGYAHAYASAGSVAPQNMSDTSTFVRGFLDKQ